MKIEERKVYRCEFCSKYYISKRHAEYHEKWCKKNPRNLRPCHNCKHLENVPLVVLFSDSYKEEEVTYIVPYCNIKEQHFYDPRLERLNWFHQNGVDCEQEPMPIECNELSEF